MTERRNSVAAATVAAALALAVVARMSGPDHAGEPEPTVPQVRVVASATAVPTAEPTPPAWTEGVVAVALNGDGTGRIALVTPGDGASEWITGFDAVADPAWSPNSSRLAFAGRRGGNWDVWIAERDTGALTRATDDGAYDGRPAWSPDGRTLAFESYRRGDLDVWRAPAPLPGNGPQPAAAVAAGDRPEIEPAWLPDGRIVVSAWADGKYQIETIAAGGEAEVLVATDGDARSPAASPAGLAFLDMRHGEGQVKLALTGSGRRGIDTLAPAASDFAWAGGGTGLVTIRSGRGGTSVELRGIELGGRLEAAGIRGLVVDGVDWAPGHAPEGLAPVGAPAPMDVPASRRPGLVVVDVAAPGPRIHADLAADFEALRSDVMAVTGRDFLGTLSDMWRSLAAHTSASAFLSWHKTGRAFDTQMELRGPGGRRDMVLVREAIGGRTYWRMYLRAGAQDGSVGRPLVEPGFAFAAGGAGGGAEGGVRATTVPAGYWIDFTAMAAERGWHRIPSIERRTFDWRRNWSALEYWHYERRDGLRWEEAIRQIYGDEELAASLNPERLRELGLPGWRLGRLGLPGG